MAKSRLTINAEGVFREGIRQKNPDPHEVAEALAAPTPIQLLVKEPKFIQRLVAAQAGREAFEKSSSPKSIQQRPKDSEAEPTLQDELMWHESDTSAASLVQRVRVLLHPVEGGVAFVLNDEPFLLPLTSRELAYVTAKLTARNEALQIPLPPELVSYSVQETEDLLDFSSSSAANEDVKKPSPRKPRRDSASIPPVLAAVNYFLHTGQEIDILERSASDGHRGLNWRTEEAVGKLVYERQGASHRVELRKSDHWDNFDDGEEVDLAKLEKLTLSQDTDFAFAMLYVASTLAPPTPLSQNQFAGGWIDLDDIMEKIGWYPSELKAADREAKRARIWDYLCYGNRAVVVGERTGKYRDSITGEELDTRIESSIWRIMSVERPIQTAMLGEVPRRVQLVISKDWEPFLASAKLAQYLPLAEVVGRIPPNKVAGDWARAIALVLARLWRMKPEEFIHGKIQPTRHELLTHYTPKTKTVEELLSSPNPKRAVRYWHDALQILVEIGFLANEGEGSRTVDDMLKPHKGYGWGKAWLNEPVDLRPGARLLLSLQERANALPPPHRAAAAKRPRKTRKN